MSHCQGPQGELGVPTMKTNQVLGVDGVCWRMAGDEVEVDRVVQHLSSRGMKASVQNDTLKSSTTY